MLDLKCNKLEIRLQRLFKQLLRLVLAEINAKNGTAYEVSDVKFVLEREVMTNAADNASIEKTEAERKQIEVNTILSLVDLVGNEEALRAVCDVLDLDYKEISKKVEQETLTYAGGRLIEEISDSSGTASVEKRTTDAYSDKS